MSSPLDNYLASVPADKTSLTDDERIANIVPLPPPESPLRVEFEPEGEFTRELVVGKETNVPPLREPAGALPVEPLLFRLWLPLRSLSKTAENGALALGPAERPLER